MFKSYENAEFIGENSTVVKNATANRKFLKLCGKFFKSVL